MNNLRDARERVLKDTTAKGEHFGVRETLVKGSPLGIYNDDPS